jgi:NitT/TauT family transport system permease protein
MNRGWTLRALPWLVVLGFFVVWQLVCMVFGVKVFILPAPSDILASLYRFRAPILEHAIQTSFTTLLGFAIAVVFGLALGVVLGASRTIYEALYPVMIGFNSIPKVAVVPILVIWFGIGTIPAVLTSFLISFFPIVVNVATGLATIEPELQDVMRALGARKTQIMWKIGIPRSMPYFFAALKVSITLAVVGSVLSETVASNNGIGYLMMAASARFDVPLVFAGLIVVAVMGVAMYEVTAWLEKRFTFWATRAQDAIT